MGLAGDVLVFMAAQQACIEILQVTAIESFTSSGPLRLLCWSRCDGSGWKADFKI